MRRKTLLIVKMTTLAIGERVTQKIVTLIALGNKEFGIKGAISLGYITQQDYDDYLNSIKNERD